MAISEATRRKVFELDHGECIFWHREPVPATDPSHRVHQGAGGLPPEHWINQHPNIGASCRPCHDRFSGPGKVYRWVEFSREKRIMRILAPNGRPVPRENLWFYNRERWEKTQVVQQELEALAAEERARAWSVADRILWLKQHGIPAAVNLSRDWIDLAAQAGYSSGEARRRVRVAVFAGLAGGAETTLRAIDIDVADRLRGIEAEEDLREVGQWFAELPPAEAWARFGEKYPGPEKRKKYRAFVGEYREIESADEAEALRKLDGKEAVIVKGGRVIAGVRKQKEAK